MADVKVIEITPILARIIAQRITEKFRREAINLVGAKYGEGDMIEFKYLLNIKDLLSPHPLDYDVEDA